MGVDFAVPAAIHRDDEMNNKMKVALRTLQTSFPGLLDTKFKLMRAYRNGLRIPFDPDFRGISLFPDAPDALFLDVGANRGQSTDAILMQTRNSRIQMFEPNPLLCEKLESQYRGNPRGTVNRFGLGDKPVEQPLFVPFYKGWMFDGLASFDKEKATSWLRGRMLFYHDRHLTAREVPCRIRRLDELGLKPFFMKLDVQGYELQALEGAERTIASFEPVLLIESPPEDEIIAFLKNLGYQFYAFTGTEFIPGQMGGRNTFFMTESKAVLVKQFIKHGSQVMVAAR